MITFTFILVVMMVVVFGMVFSLLRPVIATSQQASSHILHSYVQIATLKFKFYFAIVLMLGVSFFTLVAKVEIPQEFSKGNIMNIGLSYMISASSRYAHGDDYEHEGKTYRLVEKATYRLNNLDGLVKEITLSGKTFYLVPKK